MVFILIVVFCGIQSSRYLDPIFSSLRVVSVYFSGLYVVLAEHYSSVRINILSCSWDDRRDSLPSFRESMLSTMKFCLRVMLHASNGDA